MWHTLSDDERALLRAEPEADPWHLALRLLRERDEARSEASQERAICKEVMDHRDELLAETHVCLVCQEKQARYCCARCADEAMAAEIMEEQ